MVNRKSRGQAGLEDLIEMRGEIIRNSKCRKGRTGSDL